MSDPPTSASSKLGEVIERFIRKLDDLEPGPRARLRRNAGEPLAGSRGVLPLFYGLLPRSIVRPRPVEAFFLVATLHSIHPSRGGRGNLGRTMAEVAARPGANRDGVALRVSILIDSNRDELPFRLRQAVKFISSHDRPIDWPRLLSDILRWDHRGKHTQKDWARSYFGSAE